MDGLVKKALAGDQQQEDRMAKSFGELKNALDEALSSCQSLADPTAVDVAEPGLASIPLMPPELAKKTAERLRNAVDMGNITELKAIAEGLESNEVQFSRAILQLAEDFDFDGIQKLVEDLEGTAES
jgi:hypothetical protein